MNSRFSSKVFNQVVEYFSSIAGIGQKTAIRLVLDLAKKDRKFLLGFSQALHQLATELQYCKQCHAIAQTDCCDICANPARDASIICVVEDMRDLLALENTLQYQGLYHVLGGVIDPLRGVHPTQLHIESLITRIHTQPVREVILALRADVRGETTNFYLYRQLMGWEGKLTAIARGIGVADELQYLDEATLAKSLQYRTPLIFE